jgi:tripartite-type tricarboxylate transporter receptor subunit TctC
MWRRLAISFAIVVCGSGLLWGGADDLDSSGNGFPNRSITIVVPWSLGGPSDILARTVAAHMSRTLGQTVIVENNAGLGGTLATLHMKRAAPDGYRLLIGNTGTHAAAVALYPNLAYDPRKDFEPIGVVATAPIVILGRKNFPPQDLKEFVDYVRANAPKLDMGHGGVGSIPFIACTALNNTLGVAPRLIPYDGAGPSEDALARGRIDYMCDQSISAVSNVRTGRVKAYAIAAPERSSALPDVPTTGEAGLPEFQLSPWQTLFAPKGVPKVVVEKLNDALGKALDDNAVRERLSDLGAVIPPPDQRTPQALANLVKLEVDRWTAIIKAAGPR